MRKILLFAFILRLVLSFGPYHPDLGNHLDWGIKFWQIGSRDFYENLFWRVSWPNQPPGTIYIFAFVRKIYEVVFAIFWWLNVNISVFPSLIIPFLEEKFYVFLVKLPFIFSDLGAGWLIYKIVHEMKGRKTALLAMAVFLFNPVIWYNSAVWGQTDSLINFFGLLSVYFFWKNKPLSAAFVFLSSLYFKGSLLIFFPIILLLLVIAKYKWYKKAAVLIFTPIFFAYLSFPFVKWMSPIPWLYHLYIDRIFGHQGNMLTANAFNLWAIFYVIDFSRNDLLTFFGVSLKKWGQILLAGIYGPLIILIVKKMKEKFNIEFVFWSFVVITYASFCFLTNMHERYLYPAFPYLTILLFLNKKLWPIYILASLVFLLNMYNLWFVPDVRILKSVFNPIMIKIFSIANIVFLFYFAGFGYFSFKRQKEDGTN